MNVNNAIDEEILDLQGEYPWKLPMTEQMFHKRKEVYQKRIFLKKTRLVM